MEGYKEIPYKEATACFLRLKNYSKENFLLESKDISPIYGRLSLIGVDPIIKVTGKGDKFEIKLLKKRAKIFFEELDEQDFAICDSIKFDSETIYGKIKKDKKIIEESERSKRKNIAQVIRILISKFKINEKALIGLYGGFSYDFVRLFEEIEEHTDSNDVNDFTLFLYDTFIFFDHLKEKSSIILFRNDTREIEKEINKIENLLDKEPEELINFQIKDTHFDLKQDQYEKLVNKAIEYAEKGEVFEVVFSNVLKAKIEGDPFSLYLKYRDENPSPYLFYFDFGDEQLVGASPEMMVRCENGMVHLRPISGTAKRGADPIEDHENMIALLSDSKERSELDMLIDLGRNDLSRVCEPGIEITDYRFVEKYSRVMHTVAHLSGKLREQYTALDALVSCANAGTLTGAPKVAAMNIIEKHEKERRGYYGGFVGYLTFSGDMDTGIIIRTAHVKNGDLRFQVGATLLYDSVPEREYEETLNKARAFINTFANQPSHV
jgi:anthranilate synthase